MALFVPDAPAGRIGSKPGGMLMNALSAATSGSFPPTNSDGNNPQAGLFLSGNTLYGTAPSGGAWRYGTVFAVSTNGTGFATLHRFTGSSDGGFPIGGVILSGNTLYGTASIGGSSSGIGTVFAVNTNGTGFTNLCMANCKFSPSK
jgi:uncharacterized repeat protein (TIGR03803 family)